MNNKIVTRFAPSPTGYLHAGNYRTAVFAYLYARQNNGKFILRIEDTDKERSKKEYEENILESLSWLGLDYDEMYRQSERVERHTFYLNKLIDEGKAYISKEEAKDGSGVIKEIIRFKNPNIKIKFTDKIRGEIETDTTDLGDFVIAKNINEPLFHLAVVIDDFEMGVNIIIRGEDHISNTPRQLLIWDAIGAERPIYAHLPLVLSPDRTKLSKRKGALALTEYRDKGYLPASVLNFISMIGWNSGTEKELFSKDELIQDFKLENVQKGSAVFNQDKLDWINKEYINLMSEEDQIKNIQKFCNLQLETINKARKSIIERIHNFSEVKTMEESGDFEYYENKPVSLEAEKLIWKNSDKEKTKINLEKVLSILSAGDDMFNKIKEYAELAGKGDVLWPLRYALSGKDKSPDPFSLIYILGTEESEDRIKNAIITLDETL